MMLLCLIVGMLVTIIRAANQSNKQAVKQFTNQMNQSTSPEILTSYLKKKYKRTLSPKYSPHFNSNTFSIYIAICTTLNITTEIIANPDQKHQILYTVDSNLAVDDVALRLQRMVSATGLTKKIIRAHTLVTEKAEVYKSYDAQQRLQNRFQAPDALVTEFATLAYLSSLTESHFANRDKGDPRYALSSMSLATKMHKTLTNAQPGSEWYDLNVWLQEYSSV